MSGHLQKTQDEILLVLPQNKIVSFKQQTLDDFDRVSAPFDEIADVVAGEKRSGLGRGEILDVSNGDRPHRQRSGHRFRHHLLRLLLLDVFNRMLFYRVGMLQKKLTILMSKYV